MTTQTQKKLCKECGNSGYINLNKKCHCNLSQTQTIKEKARKTVSELKNLH